MKSVNAIMNELYLQCKECGISCLAIIGDKDNYDVVHTDECDAIVKTSISPSPVTRNYLKP